MTNMDIKRKPDGIYIWREKVRAFSLLEHSIVIYWSSKKIIFFNEKTNIIINWKKRVVDWVLKRYTY